MLVAGDVNLTQAQLQAPDPLLVALAEPRIAEAAGGRVAACVARTRTRDVASSPPNVEAFSFAARSAQNARVSQSGPGRPRERQRSGRPFEQRQRMFLAVPVDPDRGDKREMLGNVVLSIWNGSRD
jgi:hypothetical protein